uniref:Metastasis associated 1 family member 3 n=1 Tax=Gorilla gorilla gorilla TaxID=9595 RepID=A0A2I2Y1W7_GORGO
MAANMYRVGDYVYFENSSSNPYLIRRIEELNKTASGNVEAKVVCFYRRRDISNTLIMLADKHAKVEFRSCYPGWSAMARSRLTATSTSQIK